MAVNYGGYARQRMIREAGRNNALNRRGERFGPKPDITSKVEERGQRPAWGRNPNPFYRAK